jgi:hypothetical protein
MTSLQKNGGPDLSACRFACSVRSPKNGRSIGSITKPAGLIDGVGIFTCDDEFEGKPIIVRYIWSNITASSARWEQAFSPDGGKTWETNWIMNQTRIVE